MSFSGSILLEGEQAQCIAQSAGLSLQGSSAGLLTSMQHPVLLGTKPTSPLSALSYLISLDLTPRKMDIIGISRMSVINQSFFSPKNLYCGYVY